MFCMHRLFSLIFFVLVSQKQFFDLATYFSNLWHILIAEKLIVLLRDGRKLLGTLCSFDQFGKPLLHPLSLVFSSYYYFEPLMFCFIILLCSKCCSSGCLWTSNCWGAILWCSSWSICDTGRECCFDWRIGNDLCCIRKCPWPNSYLHVDVINMVLHWAGPRKGGTPCSHDMCLRSRN